MAARFTGHHPHTLDDKGRIIIPRKFRDQIAQRETGDGLVVTRPPLPCLFIYTENHWDELSQRQEALNKGSRDFWKFQRWFHANAETLTPDKQGRILIPERLRKQVKIERELIFAGCYDHIEVWEPTAWEQEQNEAWDAYGDSVDLFLAGNSPVPSSEAPPA